MSMVSGIGLGIHGLASFGDLLSQYGDFEHSKKNQMLFAKMLDEQYGGALRGLESEYNLLAPQMDKANLNYGRAQRGITDSALSMSNANTTNLVGGLKGDMEATLRDWDRVGEGVVGAYGERQNRIMGGLEGAGAQEATDIRTQYEQRGADVQQGMRQRGLAGTTLAPTMGLGVAREETDAQGRLQERLRQQKAQWDASLSADTIGAQAKYGDIGASTAAGYRGAITEAGDAGRRLSSNIALEGQQTQADLALARVQDYADLYSRYGSQGRDIAMATPTAWGNFSTANPVSFPNFSGLNQFGGSMTAYGATMQQQEDARNAASKARTANAWGMGFGAVNTGVTAGLGAGWLNAYGQVQGVNPWMWN